MHYQGMTRLSRESEMKLLAYSEEELLELINRPGKIEGNRICGADTRYTLVQIVAKRYTEAEVSKLPAREMPAPAPVRARREEPVNEQPKDEAPKAAPVKKEKPARTPSSALKTVTLTAGGRTKLQPDSIRSKIMAHLRASGATSATIESVDAFLGSPALPHLKKLEEAGWVTLA